MSRVILEDLIANFSPDKLIRFFRDKSNKFAPRQESFAQYNDENFKDGKKLGEIIFSEAEHLAVCTFQANQSLSERSGKKAQYEKGKKILKDRQYDAGIFIFYDNKGNFRFSLIYANYLGNRRDWSVFRRFTYFVSKEFTNKTFLQRIGDGDFFSLEKIKDDFSVEKVTKEFYQDIANWYFWAVQHSTFPKDAEEEENGRNIAVIRLITRMIFIWFMREQGLVPKNLFEEKSIPVMLKEFSSESSTYYQAILQNLFFATLSTKKDERKFRSETRGYKGYNPDFGNQNVFRFQDLFKNPDKLKDYFGEIPFLNGGLFECLDDKTNGIYIDGFTAVKKNQPNVPNFLFFSGEKKADLNPAYGTKNKTHKVRGLLDILSSFNFTIDENSPDDQDIALDPELLGRVFENLLASFNPETSTTARKATGSYYTPREIVDYMVAESLKAYFKTHLSATSDFDEKIDQLFSAGNEENPFDKLESKKIVELIESVRIVDPAVGSGAFPMGALNKLVFILNKVDPGNELWKQAQLSAADTIPDPRIKQDTKNRIEEFFKGKNANYGRKLYLIQKCIYGVDIQQIAVEIAKLRFFISLLVDEKIDKTKENWGIEPLPNLDFKIMQGNSLISEFLGIDFDNGQEKQDLQGQVGFGFENEDDSLIKEFERKKIDYQNESDKDKKATLKNEVEDLMIKIFETKVKKQKTGYIEDIKEIERKYSALPNKQSREEIIAKEKQKLSQKTGFDLGNIEKQLREFTSKNKTRPFFPWKLYFAEVFSEKGGFDIVIGNPPYGIRFTKSDNPQLANQYRNIFKGEVESYILFYYKGLIILHSKGYLCYITPDSWFTNKGASPFREYITDNHSIIDVFDCYKPFSGAKDTRVHTVVISKFKTEGNIRIKQVFPSNTNVIYRDYEILNSIIRAYKGNEWRFYITKYERNVFNKMESISEPLEKLFNIKYGLRTGDNTKYISGNKTEFPLIAGADIASLYKINWKPKYLKQTAGLPENYFREYFSDKKIIIQYVRTNSLNINARWIEAAYVEGNYIPLNSLNYVYEKSKDYSLLYLLGILNSYLLNKYYRAYYTDVNVKPTYLSQLPIPKISIQQQKPFVEIVDKILAITKSGDYLENPAKREEVKEYEKQIDQLVYKLYGLTPEEINIVEGGN